MTKTEHSAIIVAHGSPSAPEPQERDLQALAAKVQNALPGWTVRGVTLASKGALDAAISETDQPLIYPYFMAEGYFTGRVLAPKTEELGLIQLRPFGVEPALTDAAATELKRVLHTQDWQPEDTTLLIAAHGSAVSRTSANSTYAIAEALQERLSFRETRCGFIEEEPFVTDQAKEIGQAICLPFFALNAGHMLEDMPQALSEADFSGISLPAMIEWDSTPSLIADSLKRAAP